MSGPSLANILGPAVISLTVALGGCEAPAAGPPSAWVSLTTMQASYLADPQAPIGAGLSSVFTAGFPASYFLSAPDRIRFSPVYTDGQQMAYMTTDVWVNFREIWLQPLYVFVSAWDQRPPRLTWRTDLPWVATVSDDSAFWSPFWRVYYVVVPADTPRDRFRSSHDVLSSGLPVFPGQARLLTLQPPGGIAPEDPSTVLLPELRAPGKVGQVREQAVWVEGEREERLAIDFGENRFEWNDRYEILEQPLFFFFTRATDGQWLPLTSVPRVGGTGPLFERRPAIAPNNRPRFGSNWRLWSVRLPPTARLFVPPERVAEWEARNAGWAANLPLANIPPITAPTPAEATAALDHHAYKVLLNGDCLPTTPITVDELARCPWLDSQEALEKFLPAALVPSEILVACPYMSYAGAAVPDP
jgi:hypothetical protein